MMDVTAVSDLHGFYPSLPGGELLIIAGDLTAKHTEEEFYDFANWMRNQNYEEKIVIAGNHDTWLMEADSWNLQNWCDTGEFEYLLDSCTECDFATEEIIFKIWGSPWTKTFKGMNPMCKAFTLDTEEQLAEKWKLIPEDIDVLVTHSPPFEILDWIPNSYDGTLFHVGSKSLVFEIVTRKKPPKLWVGSHIHESYGLDLPVRQKPLIMANVSHVNEKYKPINNPLRFII
jgi:Icc-related predicted phosphoesterase